MLARNPVKGNSVVPYDTNIVNGKFYMTNFHNENREGHEFICILMGQLNSSRDSIIPYGIGRRIFLFPIRNQYHQLTDFDVTKTFMYEGQFHKNGFFLDGYGKRVYGNGKIEIGLFIDDFYQKEAIVDEENLI